MRTLNQRADFRSCFTILAAVFLCALPPQDCTTTPGTSTVMTEWKLSCGDMNISSSASLVIRPIVGYFRFHPLLSVPTVRMLKMSTPIEKNAAHSEVRQGQSDHRQRCVSEHYKQNPHPLSWEPAKGWKLGSQERGCLSKGCDGVSLMLRRSVQAMSEERHRSAAESERWGNVVEGVDKRGGTRGSARQRLEACWKLWQRVERVS